MRAQERKRSKNLKYLLSQQLSSKQSMWKSSSRPHKRHEVRGTKIFANNNREELMEDENSNMH